MATKFSVDSFVGNITKSGARANLFEVNITLPSAITETGLNDSDDKGSQFRFLVNSTAMPGYNIGEIPVSYFGRTVYFAGDTTFGDWTTTILNDEGMKIRVGIEKWMEEINSTVGNVRGAGSIKHSAMLGSATITSFSLDNAKDATSGNSEPVTKVDLKGLWPSSVSPIDLSHDAVNTIETFTCTWQYTYANHGNAYLGDVASGADGSGDPEIDEDF